MNGLFFYIGLGAWPRRAPAGCARSCRLLLAGALASAGALGVSFAPGAFHFLEDDWWLLAVCVALVLAYAPQLLLGLAPIARSERPLARGPTRSRRRSPASAIGTGAAAVRRDARRARRPPGGRGCSAASPRWRSPSAPLAR